MTYEIVIQPSALAALAAIADRRVRRIIERRIDSLAEDPEQQGKALIGVLTGYRSIRAAGQRYRVVYRVQSDRLLVVVVAVGIRRAGSRDDIYALAERLARRHMLRPPD